MYSLNNYINDNGLQNCEAYFTHYSKNKLILYFLLLFSTNIKGTQNDRLIIIYSDTNVHVLKIDKNGQILKEYGEYEKKKIIDCEDFYVLVTKNYLSKVNTQFYS